MTVVSAQLVASVYVPAATILQIVLLNTRTAMDMDTHTKHINTHDKKKTLSTCCSLSLHPYLSLWGAEQTAEHSVVSLPSKPPSSPSRLPVERENFKGRQRNERGHFSLGPGVKLTAGLRVLWTSHSSSICWGAEWWSGGAGTIRERQGGSMMETETQGKRWRETADKSNLATPHLCKTHLIFSFTYF